MESLELLGIVLVMVGIIGLIVMLKGRRPNYPSTTERANNK